MTSLPLVISYYTKNTPYEEEVKYLIASCQKFGVEYLVEGVEDLGSWEKNCAFKPYFIRDKMKELQRPLLWVDADAVFLKPMQEEVFMQADLAAFCDAKRWEPSLVDFLKFADPEKSLKDASIKTLYESVGKLNTARFFIRSGTVYINATFGGVQGLDFWCKYSDLIIQVQDNFSYYSDGISLYCAFLARTIQTVSIPAAYCKIFDKQEEGLSFEDVVIEHHQASRRFNNSKKIEADGVF